MKKREFFKIEGEKIKRMRKHCPKCGPGVFLAEHKNRFSCGKCGYTEFKGGVKPQVPKERPIVEAPVEKTAETPIETSKPDIEIPAKQSSEEIPPEPESIKEPSSLESTEASDKFPKEDISKEKTQSEEVSEDESPKESMTKPEKKVEEKDIK